MYDWGMEDRRERFWALERYRKEEKAAREKAVEEGLRRDARQGVFAALKWLHRGRIQSVNLRSPELRKKCRACEGDVLSTLKWDTPLAKMVAETLCWLRDQGAIGIVGFSGNNAKTLQKFLARSNRFDIRIFPALSAVEI